MAWKIQRIIPNPIQSTVVIVNDDPDAGLATDYRSADRLARETFGRATLKHRGYLSDGTATRIYASQAY